MTALSASKSTILLSPGLLVLLLLLPLLLRMLLLRMLLLPLVLWGPTGNSSSVGL